MPVGPLRPPPFGTRITAPPANVHDCRLLLPVSVKKTTPVPSTAIPDGALRPLTSVVRVPEPHAILLHTYFLIAFEPVSAIYTVVAAVFATTPLGAFKPETIVIGLAAFVHLRIRSFAVSAKKS
jgi:hypothetical protein